MPENVMLTLPKIGCQGCMKKVVAALGTVAGVEIIETSVPSKTVLLHYEDSHTEMALIEAALQTIGHVIGKQEIVSR
jgi:copper chaperone CopZ